MPYAEEIIPQSEALRDSLGLYGWVIYWEASNDSARFHTSIDRPGRKYVIDHDYSTHETQIIEKLRAPLTVVNFLHFLGSDIPNAPWLVNVWQYYQGITVYSMFFWIITGVYFWLTGRSKKRLEVVVILASTVIMVSMILWLWLVG